MKSKTFVSERMTEDRQIQFKNLCGGGVKEVTSVSNKLIAILSLRKNTSSKMGKESSLVPPLTRASASSHDSFSQRKLKATLTNRVE